MRLVSIADVEKLICEVTNTAIEQNKHKCTIQKNIVYELSMLHTVEATDKQVTELLGEQNIDLED